LRSPLPFLLAFALTAASSAADQAAGLASASTAFQIAEIPSPAAAGARAAILATNAGGALWMAWFEPAATGFALRCAAFNATAHRWADAHTVNAADLIEQNLAGGVLALAAGPSGQLTAAWSVKAQSSLPGGASHALLLVSQSADGGVSWSKPTPLSRESTDLGYPALATLADGRVLAVWLDRRGRKDGDRGASLYARFVTGREAAAPDYLLDAHACEGCQPSLAPLLDGGAMLAYRERTEADVVDARILRLHGRRWENRHEINSDRWTDPQSPADSPQLAVDGGRVAVGWFTAADRDPRIAVSISPDAGARFLMPLRAQTARAVGHAATALLHDGAMLVTWIETPPGGGPETAGLQRASPEFTLDPPASLGPVAEARLTGSPTIALVNNYSGEALTAQAMVALTRPGDPSTVHTLLVTIPESELISAASDNCHCAPTPLQLLGYPVRGTVTAVSTEHQTVTLDVDAVPGVMDAGPHVFSAGHGALAALLRGRECLARIERQGDAWRIFDVRLLQL
jgi:hypothetical protein